MKVLEFIKTYWTQILFLVAILGMVKSYIEATRCSLRNDILEIWDKARLEKKITKYQLQALELSYTEYKKLKGNSFVDDIHERVKSFEIID